MSREAEELVGSGESERGADERGAGTPPTAGSSTAVGGGGNPSDPGSGPEPGDTAAGTAPGTGAASPLQLALAFAAVYLIWGSTYLAIRFAIETLPPLLMAGVRFTVAGGVLYGWMRLRGAPAPPRRGWVAVGVPAFLMILVANGGVSWAEQTVPSGIAALTVATTPLWMVVLARLHPREDDPTRHEWAGVVAGLVGVAFLVAPGDQILGRGIDVLGFAALLLASLAWASGSIHNRFASLPGPQLLSTAMTMLLGGVLLVVASAGIGELRGFDPAAVSTSSLLALGYLVVMGSIVAFSAYIWLLKRARPALVGTYAYVNPVVALVLGWTLADEPLTPRALLAATVILGSVVVVNRTRQRPRSGGRKNGVGSRDRSGDAGEGRDR